MNQNLTDFLKQVKRFIGKVPFTKDAIAMYFCMIDSHTSLYAKGVIAGALAYFLSPMDAIPDLIAGLGFTDDASVIATALAIVCSEIEETHWQQAERFFNK